jgi:hypothetical protein
LKQLSTFPPSLALSALRTVVPEMNRTIDEMPTSVDEAEGAAKMLPNTICSLAAMKAWRLPARLLRGSQSLGVQPHDRAHGGSLRLRSTASRRTGH